MSTAQVRIQSTGKRKTSVDVKWGEGTTDEMCLGVFYVTGE